MTYSMSQQLAQGQRYERFLDSLFAPKFEIREANRQEQRIGIDRHFTDKKTGATYKIEYKADSKAAKTGNAFVETVSVDIQNKLGWAYTCQADYLIYYVVGCGPAYILNPRTIKNHVSKWAKAYPSRSISNDGYNTVGLLVPLKEFEQIAYQILST